MARRKRGRSPLTDDVREAVDDFGMADLVDGLVAYCEEQEAEDGPEARDWRRLGKVFEWVAGRVDELGLS